MPTFAGFAQRKSWVAAPNVRFLQVVQFSLWAQRKSGFCPMCQTGMSTLGWELPLEATCVNGSFAQKVYFAQSEERPIADLGSFILNTKLHCSFHIAEIRASHSNFSTQICLTSALLGSR